MTQATTMARDRARMPRPAAAPGASSARRRRAPRPASPLRREAAPPLRADRRPARRRGLSGGFYWWLSGGRYISTDNAYVGADKALITPYVTGPIVAIHVKEGQHVKVGDPLFDIDPAPYETAVALWRKARLEAAKVEFANLQGLSTPVNVDQIKMGEQSVDLHQADFDRKHELADDQVRHASPTRTRRDARSCRRKQILEFVAASQDTVEGQARRRSRQLRSRRFPTICRPRRSSTTPSATSATRMSRRRSPASRRRSTRSSLAASRRPASRCSRSSPTRAFGSTPIPKESDLTYVKQGLPASVTIDTFPGREWKGTVCSIAPGTGAQFAILPPQNASGNWVKVVQRIPLALLLRPG